MCPETDFVVVAVGLPERPRSRKSVWIVPTEANLIKMDPKLDFGLGQMSVSESVDLFSFSAVCVYVCVCVCVCVCVLSLIHI